MTRRVLAVSAPLWLLVVGCIDANRPYLVSGNAASAPARACALSDAQRAPATEEAAKRVIVVGQRVVLANPQMGLRPVFCTMGTPDPEIFHRGTGGLDGCQVMISEGLIRRCPTDGQLAAVLCYELGRIVAEREAQASPELRQGKTRLDPEAPIGNDAWEPFGTPDGTRMMEQAKLEKQRRKPLAPLVPEVLAHQYLTRAGYADTDLEVTASLRHEAESNCTVEKHWGAAIGKPAVIAPPPTELVKPLTPASPLSPREPEQPIATSTPSRAASPPP
jgi:hypothetical protein